MDELKPCPFCGSRGELIERHNPMSKWKHSVDCAASSCGASGPVEATKAGAIAAWNARDASGHVLSDDLRAINKQDLA